ncbi:MAG TPA: hypothetical protein DCF68_17875 [Cyanothece sp. UBA12306]|nr:hypothetical protein [Cyanothece sp. UBA12306]
MKKSHLILATLTSAAFLGATASSANAAIINRLWFEGEASLLIDTANVELTNNAIDFKETGAAGPEWGTLGDFTVTSSEDGFGMPNMNGDIPIPLGTEGKIMDLIIPGENVMDGVRYDATNLPSLSDGTIVANALRFDSNGNGIFGDMTDITYSITAFTTSFTENPGGGTSGTFNIFLEGYFQEVDSFMGTLGESDEMINLAGERLYSTFAVISGGVPVNPDTLTIVDCELTDAPLNNKEGFTDGIDNLDPNSDCASAFNTAPASVISSTDGVFATVKTPEPSGLVSIAGIAALGFTGLYKRKKQNQNKG